MSFPHAARTGAASAWSERVRSIAALPAERQARLVAAILGGIAFVLLLFLVVPLKTYVPQYLTDHFVFLDGADRVLRGQLPNRDFHSALGLLNYLLPAAGYWLSGSMGGMMPVATAVFTVLLLPLLLHACLSRLTHPLTLAFGAYILILTIAPVHVGDTLPLPTFAVFYNRWGYAVLSVLFLFVLPRKDGVGSERRDIIVMAACLLILFYLKISYFAVAGAFVAGMVLFPHTRRIALGSAIAAALGLIVVELMWSGTRTYLEDIAMAGQASGAVRGGLKSIAVMLSDTLVSGFILLCALAIALVSGVGRGTLLMCLYMAASGVLLANQNHQGPSILTFIPAALVAASAPRKPGGADIGGTRLAYWLCLAALSVPSFVMGLATLALHAVGASRAPAASAVELDGFIGLGASPEEKLSTRRLCLAPGAQSQSLEDRAAYLLIMKDGQRLLSRHPRLAGTVFSFDNANPMNALTDRAAPAGVDSWYHYRRSFSDTAYRPADELFRDVDIIMVPRRPAWEATSVALLKLYGHDLRTKFHLVARTDCWEAYRKNAAR